jgi:hypothetical protein
MLIGITGEKRMLGASQDLEQFLRKVYSFCKKQTGTM